MDRILTLLKEKNFAFKHPYFFENYTFKFEGLQPDIQEKFEKLSMGAKVSDESQYILTDTLSTSLDEKGHYYSLSYLLNSILAKEPLKIEDYKFSNLIQNTNQSRFCCMNARYILKKTCMSLLNQCICKLCIVKTELLKKNKFSSTQDTKETNKANIHEFNQKLHLYIKKINNLKLKKSMERVNDVSLVQQNNSLHLNENSDNSQTDDENHISVQSLTNGISRENKANETNNDSSKSEIIEIISNVNHVQPSCSRQVLKKPEVNKPISIDRWKRIRTISNSSNTSSSDSDIECLTRKRKNKRQKLSSSSSEIILSDKSSSNKSSSDTEQNFIQNLNKNMNREEWWLYLPTPEKRNSHYKCLKIKHRGRGRDYTYMEKRLMIAYLIKNGKIQNGTSRKPWIEMIEDGYLQDRTSESLNNHYRRVLLPKIETFKLPKDIEKIFIYDRKLHLNRSYK
ncbi:uncharacterized protein LOC131668235 isoform X2 [Phymastichus coffea]|uniref:uncharacterized protein LOC131668235 isoform X2 n=1 Tax=Phymastichus coffea TaxID=108790 RepID=UPI00273AE7BE|nr:uncharacterized protein LOC131668235 isoform X2 [Phymastichus coffea]